MKLRRVVAALAVAAVSAVATPAVSTPSASATQRSATAPSAGAIPSAVPSAATPSVDDGDVRGIARVGGKTVIVGHFTSVDGTTRDHVAAFDPATGTLTSFAPTVDGEVRTVVPGPNDHTVYIGGDFSTVSGSASQFVALVDLDTSKVVPSFTPPSFDYGGVNDLVKRGNRLYLAGFFAHVGGMSHAGLASLDATTGALDPFVDVQLAGHHNDSGSGAQGWIGPWSFDVTPDGSQMAVTGNFKTADGLLRDQLAVIDLTGSSAKVRTDWATSRYSPYCYNWAFDGYTRGVAFSPDGSYFVVNATGGGVRGSLCDATSRFETGATGTDVQPTWINQAGGDTMWGVAVTDDAVFVGGHARWSNNPLGVDAPREGAVPRPGLAALDPVSGRPLKWNPGRNPPGKAVYAILATSDGVYVGSNTDWVGNFEYKRPKVVFFPYTGDTVAPTTTATLPGTVYLGGARDTAASNVLYRVNAGGPALQSLDGGPDWSDDSGATNPLRTTGSNSGGPWPPIQKVDSKVPASTPWAVFDRDRWDPKAKPEMKWSFPVKSGTPLRVRLYFANRPPGTSTVGARVFNVGIDGHRVLSNFDIVKAVGDQTGTMRSFKLTSDGTVNINFGHGSANHPLVDAIEILRTDVSGSSGGGSGPLDQASFTGSSAGSRTAAGIGGNDWGHTRGAFMVGSTVFYGKTDGFLYSRGFDGESFGPATKINPYHDPYWKDVDNHLGGTFDGNVPSLYGQMSNVTGMLYSGGRLYYTLYDDSTMHSRWFSPDSGIVDETTTDVPSSVRFGDVGGMFAVGSTLYYSTRSDGNLWKVAFDHGTVTGSRTGVSGPSRDGVDWRSTSMFLRSEPEPNQAPVAGFASSCGDQGGCSFDGSASADSDGSVVKYAWDFGDGSSGSGASPDHVFVASGSYTVTLTVTDDGGARDSVSHEVSVSVPASPVSFVGAVHSGSGASRVKQVDVPSGTRAGDTLVLVLGKGSSSTWTGPSGLGGWSQLGSVTNVSVTSTVWSKVATAQDLGGTVRLDNDSYSKALLSLVVYRGVDAGRVAAVHSVDSGTAEHVTPRVSAAAGDWLVSLWSDKSTSTDSWTAPEGVTVRDEATGTGSSGRYGLVVGDSAGPLPAGGAGGLTATTNAKSQKAVMWSITLPPASAPEPNVAPSAGFASSCGDQGGCSFDGSASADSDGSVVKYAWDFGDGSSGSGASPDHVFVASGSYTVTLTVTDDGGARDSVSHEVSVSVPASPVSFVGAVHSGSGASRVKQVDVPSGTRAGDTLVLVLGKGSSSTWTGPSGLGGWSQLGSVTNVSVTSTVWSKVATAQDLGGTVRLDNDSYSKALLSLVVYRGVDAGRVAAVHSVDSGTAEHVTPRVSAAAGDWLVSLWSDKSTSTDSWTAPEGVTVRDEATGTGSSGRYGLVVGDSAGPLPAGEAGGLTATTNAKSQKAVMWSITLPPASAPEPNVAPSAGFASSCGDQGGCSFDGSASADSDGSVVKYAWDFGDGSSGSGASPDHVFVASGSYTVTLTVTDDGGARDSVSHEVSVSVPASPVSFVGAVHSGSGASRVKQVDVPSGTRAGDTLVLVLGKGSSSTWTGPSGLGGWSQLGSVTNVSVTSTVWSKVATAQDLGGTVRLDNDSYSKALLSLVVYRGVDAGRVAAVHSVDSGTAEHVTPRVSAAAGDWLVSLWSDKSTSTDSWTAPEGVTVRDEATGTGSSGRYGLVVGDSAGPLPAGEAGGLTATTNAKSQKAVMWSITLPPAS